MIKKFISCPLCALNLKYDYKQLTMLILSFGIVEFSKKDEWQLPDELLELKDEEPKDEDYAYWAYSRVFHLTGSNGNELIKNHRIVKNNLEFSESQNGKDAYFRIGIDLIMNAHKGSFSEREFRVYCAIRSILGSRNPFLRITTDRIIHCMYGYKIKSAFEKTNIVPITKRQLRTTIEKLIDKNLITSFTNKKRFTYYSTKLKLPELINAVKKYLEKKRMNKRSRQYSV
jgi:hypothetical protein